MDEQCKAALELLVQNGYLEAVKGKFRCTAKLNDGEKPDPKIVAGLDTTGWKITDWEALYINFITDCRIPRRGESSDGGTYDLNKYSQDAMKRFRQMLEREGIKYDLLVKVTAAYYKAAGRYKKTISNYITESLWRMDYMTLKDQPEQQQQQTLKQQIDDSETFTRDRIG